MKNFKTYKNFKVDKSVTEAKVWTLISGADGFLQPGGGTTLDLKDALKFKNIKDATKASKEAMGQGIPNMVHVMNESVNEADINKLHKPFVDDIYKAVGVIDKILSKNKPPKVPKDIWGKLYGLAGDMTEWADELLTLKESNSSLLVESKFTKFMSSLGRHAISGIINYFHENPDALKEVLSSMKSSDNKGVQSAFKEIR